MSYLLYDHESRFLKAILKEETFRRFLSLDSVFGHWEERNYEKTEKRKVFVFDNSSNLGNSSIGYSIIVNEKDFAVLDDAT